MAPAPQVMALSSALCAAVATTLIQRGLRRSNSYAGFWINISVGVIGLWSAVLVLVPFSEYKWRAVPYFVFSGVVGTAGGRFFRVMAIQKVGASVAAAINNLAPLISSVLDLPPKIWTIWGLRNRPQVRSSRHEEDRHEKPRYTDQQIAQTLRQAEQGTAVAGGSYELRLLRGWIARVPMGFAIALPGQWSTGMMLLCHGQIPMVSHAVSAVTQLRSALRESDVAPIPEQMEGANGSCVR